MPDPFARKTYLHVVPDPVLSVRFSTGKRTRALQLQSFLKTLSAAAAAKTPSETAAGSLNLAVLSASDWRRQLSAPYGWGTSRRLKEETGTALLLPAAYPPRLIARWDAVRLRAAQQGVRAPGSVASYLDTLLGLEWAHALQLSKQQGRAPRPWLREVAAAYLYQAVLVELEDRPRLEYLSAWAQVQQKGAQPGTVELKAFVYPRSKQPLDNLLWLQSALWLRAAELGRTRGWALAAADVREVLQTGLQSEA